MTNSQVKQAIDETIGNEPLMNEPFVQKVLDGKKQSKKKVTFLQPAIIFLLFLAIGTMLYLIPQSDKQLAVDSKEAALVAKEEDFESHFYESDRYAVYLHEDVLIIYGTFIGDNRKSIIADVLLSGEIDSPFIRKEYSDAKVETKGDKYLITAEGDISLEFTKFMEHIIVDSYGMEYIRKDK